MCEAVQNITWNLEDILRGKKPYALLLLNHAVSQETAAALTDLWHKAAVRVCVDGATNGYHRHIRCYQNPNPSKDPGDLTPEDTDKTNCKASFENGVLTSCMEDAPPRFAYQENPTKKETSCVDVPLPDFICGDFDSAKPQLLQHYSDLGVPIIRTEDQNFTDFSKALQQLKRYLDSNISIKISSIIVAVEISALRFDHVFANINTLHKAWELGPLLPVVLVSRSTVQLLLPAGQSVITPSGHAEPECNYCAYIPLCGPTTVTTSGLKWDVENATAQFGGLVSTSNQFACRTKQVHITTDKPLLFIMNTPAAAVACACGGGGPSNSPAAAVVPEDR